MKILNLFVSLCLLTLLGCTSVDSLLEGSASTVDYPVELKRARSFVDAQKCERAHSEVDSYLSASPRDVYWHGQALILKGEIEEKQKQEDAALETYRKVVTHSVGYDTSTVARALYRMSWVYERQMRYEEMLTVLLDLEKLLGASDRFVKDVETPGRIANAYYVLNFWDQALAQKKKVTPEVFEDAKRSAKNEAEVFQARLYLAFQGLKPTTATPFKSKEIIASSQTELLEVLEMADSTRADRASLALQSEYQRYLFHLRVFKPVKNPVETREQNVDKIAEYAEFVDFINDLRANRRPPELVVNQRLDLEFFKTVASYEQEAKSTVMGLEYGLQKASRDHNPDEAPPKVVKPKKPQPPVNKAP